MGTARNFVDKLVNAFTGTGTSRDVRSAYAYESRPLTQQEIAAAYSGSGLMRKIVQIPALDMVREWRDWKLESDDIAKVEELEKLHGIQQKVRQAEVLRGMGGGALILGLPGDPTSPAPAPGAGQLAFVHVVSRWHLSFAAIQEDATRPGYGEPLMWKMATARGQQDIHPSRVIPFRADTTAALAMTQGWNFHEAFWGESTVQQVLSAVTDNDAARAAFAALLHKARLLRIGIPNLMDTVSTDEGTVTVQKRMQVVALAESLHNATIYDSGDPETGKGGEEITDTTYTFAGAKDILNAFGEFVAAISDIPATRLLGRAPEGMNASGESQQADWRKKVRARQTLELGPCIDRLDRYLVGSALGTLPDGAWYDWSPLDTPSEKENAERFKMLMEASEKLAMLGAMPERAFNRGLQSLMIEEGFYPELEQALSELSDDERWGIEADMTEIDEPEAVKGGEPSLAGEGGTGLEADPPRRAANDAAPRPLYVHRKLQNADEFIRWAKSQGFETTLSADDLHVTIAYSRTPVDWMKVGQDWHGDDKGELVVPAGGARLIERLGDDGKAIVLLFNSSALAWRHEAISEAGASWDWPEYQPHITITWDKPEDLDLATVEPFRGALRFGPEAFEELNEDWRGTIEES